MVWRGTLGKEIIEGLRPAFDLIYPPRCGSCGAPIAAHGALCEECWGELEFPGSVEMAQTSHGERHSGIIAATLYNDMSRSLILKFKHGGKLALAPILGRMIASRIHNDEGEMPLIIPVPLHRTRIWQRGFNQSAMLAREVANAGKGELLVDGLVRVKRTPSLGDLPSDTRHQILRGAIAVRRGAREMVRGRSVILIDDVMTSGATSTACVEALLGAGADTVRIACFARAKRAPSRS
ncbi:ComF family protein [Erythrobacter sp. SCSIO 43205]|nr:ComF family protein [Erythrobacter sp. SCSIO 43205]